MPITYDIKTDRLYNKGVEQGIEKTKFHMISKALIQGVLTIEQIAEMAEVSTDYVISAQSELKKNKGVNNKGSC